MSCKTINIDLANVPPVPLQIGVAGENAFRTITFDASKWGAGYPDATYTVVYRRSDGYLYPVLVNASADAIVWNPTATDTAVSGNGQLEVRLLDGETIGKTIIMQTYVAPSLTGDESTPPQPAPDWVNDVAADADKAEAAVSHYPKIVNGVWFVWNAETGEFVSTGISAQGADGVSPTVTVTAISGGHRVTITDASGDHVFDVMDGEGSQGGAVESVNGKTGVVVLDAEDVGALPDDTVIPTVPTNVSAFTNDAGYLTQHQSLEAYRTSADQDTIDAAQDQAIAAKYTKPSSGIPASDLAPAVQTSLGKADTALQPAALQTELDENVLPARFVLVRNGNTITTVDTYLSIVMSFMSTARRVMFVFVLAQSGGTVTTALELYPTMIDTNNRLMTLVGYFGGNRYSTTLTATSPSETMTGTLVVEPIVTESDIPTAVSELTNDSGYQTAQDVQTAISGKADTSAIPSASSASPAMDGTASAGSSAAYARADHVHPSDTTRLSTTGNAYRSASIPMGHLDATSTATVMTATVDGITELRDGVCMWLRNGVITSASGFTLNVNGLGAKPCYSSLAAASRSTTIFNVNYTMLFVYNSTRVDGGCWDIVYGVDTNTTYTPPKLGFGYGTCTTAAATAAKTASISSYALTAGGIVSIKFDNDVPANATLNISSKGAKAIHHRGAAITAGVIKAGDTATFVYSTYYHLISIDRDEAGDTLPAVTASDNGKFLRVVSGAWAAQAVPSAESNSFGGGS